MGQPVVHFEIGCTDSAKTADFFSGLFGWNIQAISPATMINTGAAEPSPGLPIRTATRSIVETEISQDRNK